MPSDLIRGWRPVRVKENASNQESGAPFRFNRSGKGSKPNPDA